MRVLIKAQLLTADQLLEISVLAILLGFQHLEVLAVEACIQEAIATPQDRRTM